MRPTTLHMLSTFAWMCYVLALVGGSLTPTDLSGAPEHSDKLIHALAYALLVAFWPARWTRSALVLFGCAAGLGVLLEVAQGVLPTGRFMDPWDALANALGAALGLGLLYLRRRWRPV